MLRWLRSVAAVAAALLAVMSSRCNSAVLPTLGHRFCRHSFVEAVSGLYRNELPEYEVIDGTQQYRTNIVPNTYYNLYCSSIDNINGNDIPKVHTNDISDLNTYFFIGQCPLPPGSYADLMKKLGVQTTPKLIIRDIKGNLSLRRNHLNGLDQLNIRSLSLYSSGITDLPDDIFQDSTQLKILNLSVNKLRIGSKIFRSFKKLKALYMSHCGLTLLPEGLFALPALEQLYLEGNSLKLRSEMFARLPSLRVLSLSGNSLETLPVDLFAKMGNLRRLNLMNNPLTTLPAGLFDHNTKLIQIAVEIKSLSENELIKLNVTTGCAFAERKPRLYVKDCR